MTDEKQFTDALVQCLEQAGHSPVMLDRAWHFIHVVASTMVSLGHPLTVEAIYGYSRRPDTLAIEYMKSRPERVHPVADPDEGSLDKFPNTKAFAEAARRTGFKAEVFHLLEEANSQGCEDPLMLEWSKIIHGSQRDFCDISHSLYRAMYSPEANCLGKSFSKMKSLRITADPTGVALNLVADKLRDGCLDFEIQKDLKTLLDCWEEIKARAALLSHFCAQAPTTGHTAC